MIYFPKQVYFYIFFKTELFLNRIFDPLERERELCFKNLAQCGLQLIFIFYKKLIKIHCFRILTCMYKKIVEFAKFFIIDWVLNLVW